MHLSLQENQIVPTFGYSTLTTQPYLGPWLGAGPWLADHSDHIQSTAPSILLFYLQTGWSQLGKSGVGVSQSHPNVEWFPDQSPSWRPPLLSFSCPLKFLRAASPAAPEPFYKGRWILGEQGDTRAGAPSVCVNLSSDHTHDFLLYLGVLSINVGIAHLPILISAKERGSVSTRGRMIPTHIHQQKCFKTWPFHPKVKDFVTALQDKGINQLSRFFSTQTPVICL